MLIIKLESEPNGAHSSKICDCCELPAGWIVVPSNLEQKSISLLPFVLLTTENGVVTGVEDDVEARGNVPKPEILTDPMDEIRLAVAELAVTAAQKDAENKLAIAELAEAMIGGTK